MSAAASPTEPKPMFSWQRSESQMSETPSENGGGGGGPPVSQTQSWPGSREDAVCVRSAYKNYGSKKKPNVVLFNLNMTVGRGTIYGLLGASGCGKTTLLSCIVGRRRLDMGDIYVLGGKPGSKESGVPGKKVGYMPQEIALYGEFTIRETLQYFGWIYGMARPEINSRLEFLLKFLELPGANRLVNTLSGGQARRVSFAVALMHDPELLILDEPTVGVDPLLRQSIWQHLVQITADGNKTVIITTHYIEEARQAHTIGLMRNGRLLAEESPQLLLTIYNAPSLEDVFLKLSRQQGSSHNLPELSVTNNSSLSSLYWGKKEDPVYIIEENGVVGLNFHQSKEVLINGEAGNKAKEQIKNAHKRNGVPPKRDTVDTPSCNDCSDVFPNVARLGALLHKNFLRMVRNVGVMFFIFVLPVSQVILFCLAIGQDPRGLHLAIVNDELHNHTSECIPSIGCDFTNLSCRYLTFLKNATMVQDFYPDRPSADNAVREGKAWGSVYFQSNFSDHLFTRVALGKDADNETVYGSMIRIRLDMSNEQIGLTLSRDLAYAYRDFTKQLLQSCGEDPHLADIPVVFDTPIYGENEPSFTEFVAPGIILSIVFFLAVALTSSALIIERLEGLLDRSFVAGVTPGEILISHVITQFVVMVGQTTLVLVFMLLVFGVSCEGPIGWVILLTVLQGLCGMCFGFVISASCDLERNAMQFALGSFYPSLLLSGIIWPIEGMPCILRYISVTLPQTMACISMRCILARGWDITNPSVYIGFIVTFVWIFLFLTITFAIMKTKKS